MRTVGGNCWNLLKRNLVIAWTEVEGVRWGKKVERMAWRRPDGFGSGSDLGAEGKGGIKRVSALYNWVVASIMVNNSGWKPGLGGDH